MCSNGVYYNLEINNVVSDFQRMVTAFNGLAFGDSNVTQELKLTQNLQKEITES